MNESLIQPDFESLFSEPSSAYTASNPLDYIHIASQGIPAGIIDRFRSLYKLSLELTANLLNISEPTIYRWVKANKILDRNVSIKLLELTELFKYGAEVFGSKENFFKWAHLSNTALGGLEPIVLLEMPEGISKVRTILGRIEHGVYS